MEAGLRTIHHLRTPSANAARRWSCAQYGRATAPALGILTRGKKLGQTAAFTEIKPAPRGEVRTHYKNAYPSTKIGSRAASASAKPPILACGTRHESVEGQF